MQKEISEFAADFIKKYVSLLKKNMSSKEAQLIVATRFLSDESVQKLREVNPDLSEYILAAYMGSKAKTSSSMTLRSYIENGVISADDLQNTISNEYAEIMQGIWFVPFVETVLKHEKKKQGL